MKRLLNILVFLLVFAISGCYSDTSPETKLAEPGLPEESIRDRGLEREAVTPMPRAHAPAEETAVTERLTPVGRRLVTMDGPSTYSVSMVYPSADCGIIQLDKTMPKEVQLNEPFEYGIRITNLTDVPFSNVVVTEDLPDNFRLAGTNPTVQRDGNKLVWTMLSLGSRASEQVTVAGMATKIDSLKPYTTVTYTARTSADIQVVQPMLQLTKKAPAEALLCEPIPVEFTVANLGTGSTEDVKIVDTLPAGLKTADGKSEVTLDVGTLAAGQSRQFSVELKAAKTGVYVSKAVASSASRLTAESEATVTTVRQPVLTIAKNGPERKYPGRPVTYEITVANVGDGPAKNTVVEDTIPVEVVQVEASDGAKLSDSKLVWQLGTIEPQAVKTVRVSYTPTQVCILANSVTATADCAQAVTASARTSIVGIGAVRLEVIDIDDPVEVGGNTTYVITVTNQGSAEDTNIHVVCTLEDTLEYVSSAGATTGSIVGNTVNFAPLRSLAPKATAIWRLVARGVRPGDVRFKVTLNTDQLARPVEESEATHVYK